jgi:hypothetical protein
MRIVAVEEHFTFSDLLSRIDSATLILQISNRG